MRLKKIRALSLIEVEITEETRAFAKNFKFKPPSDSTSYDYELDLRVGGIRLGVLGETVFMKAVTEAALKAGVIECGGPAGCRQLLRRDNLSSYDFFELAQGLRIDVKTTVKKSPPEPHWVLQVSESNRPRYQLANGTAKNIIFYEVTVRADLNLAWLTAYISAADFFAKAKFYKKGQRRRENDPFVFRADTWEVEYHECEPPAKLMPALFGYKIYPPCNSCNLYVFKKLDPFCKLSGQLIDERCWRDGCAGHIDRYAKSPLNAEIAQR